MLNYNNTLWIAVIGGNMVNNRKVVQYSPDFLKSILVTNYYWCDQKIWVRLIIIVFGGYNRCKTYLFAITIDKRGYFDKKFTN